MSRRTLELAWQAFFVAVLLAALLVLPGCSPFTGPTDGVRFDPPAIYHEWWLESQACVMFRVVLPYEQVKWYVTPDTPRDHNGQAGAALEMDGTIWIWQEAVTRKVVIQHELVHAVNDIEGHPYNPFGRCNL